MTVTQIAGQGDRGSDHRDEQQPDERRDQHQEAPGVKHAQGDRRQEREPSDGHCPYERVGERRRAHGVRRAGRRADREA